MEMINLTEAQWLGDTSLLSKLIFILERGNMRSRYLFGCASCRRVWNLLDNDLSHSIIEMAERYADGDDPEGQLFSLNTQPHYDNDAGVISPERTFGLGLSYRVLESLHAVERLTFPYVDIVQIVYGTSVNPSRDYIPTQHDLFIEGSGGNWNDRTELVGKAKIFT